MRIDYSNMYYGHRYGDCPVGLEDCTRHFCHEHRLLWRDCDTAKQGMDDTYSNGRPHYIWDLGDCPRCEYESRQKRLDRMVTADAFPNK